MAIAIDAVTHEELRQQLAQCEADGEAMAAEIERLRGDVLALHAVIHLAWVGTCEGSMPMMDNVREAIQRALRVHEQSRS